MADNGYGLKLSIDKDYVNKVKNEFVDILKELQQQADKNIIKIKIQTVNDEIIKTHSNLKNVNDIVNETSRSTQSLAQNFGNVVSKCSQWALGMGTVYEAVKQVKEGISYISNLDLKQTNIQMVGDYTPTQVKELTKSYSDLAGQLHTTTKETMDSAESFLRAGHSIDESKNLIKTSVIGASISGQSSKEMSEELIAISNGFRMNASDMKEMMSIVDQISTADNKSASSFAEISTAMKNCSNSAQMAKVDFSHLVTYLTVVSDVSRKSASTIGDSFKAQFARYENVKGGKKFSIEGDDLSNVERDLKKYADVKIRSDVGTFKSYETVIDELKGKWSGLNEVSKAAISKAMAGTTHWEDFAVLMNNMDKVDKMLKDLGNSAGSAEKKYNDDFKNSIQAKINDLQHAKEKLYESVISSDAIKVGLEDLTNIINTLKLLTTTEQNSGIALAGLSASFILLIKNTNTLKNAFAELEIIKSSFAIMSSRIGVVSALGDAFTMLAGSIKTSLLAFVKNPVVLMGAAIAGVTAIIINHVQHQADLKQQIDNLKTSYEGLTQSIKENNAENMKTNKKPIEQKETEYQNLLKQKKELEDSINNSKNTTTYDPRLDAAMKNVDTSKLNDVNKKIAEVEAQFKAMGVSAKDAQEMVNKANAQIADDDKLSQAKTNIEFYNKVLGELNSKGKLSDETTQDIIGKHKELVPYLQNEVELHQVLGQKIQEQQSIEQQVMLHELSNNQDFYSSMLKNNADYFTALKQNYGINAGSYKTYTDLIEAINKTMLGNMLQDWDKYYSSIDEALSAQEANMNTGEMDATLNMNGDNAHDEKYKNEANAIDSKLQNLEKGKQAIQSAEALFTKGAGSFNQSLDNSTNELNNGYTPAEDGATKATKKNTAAQEAQKEAIDKVKEATKEYETELKNLSNIETQLELTMSHMDDTSEKYRNGLMEEVELLKQKNGFLQKGIDLNNSQAGVLGGYTSAGGSQLGQQIVNDAQRYLNTPYVWGGESPSGFDCSGLVQYVLHELNVDIGRTTYEQINAGTAVSRDQLQPGDLVFFGTSDNPHHVGIYAGGGEMIEAPHTGDVVKVAPVDRSDYLTARRVTGGGPNNNSSSASTSMPTSMTYKEMVDAAASKYGTDPNLIAAVIEQESDWKATEKSSAGAVGLMQLMPETAESMGLSADQRTDPLKNIMAGTKYLAGLINKYGEEKGVALYNTGEYGGGNYGYASSVESKKQAYASGSKSMSTTSADVTSDTDVLSELDTLNSKTEDYQKQIMQNASKILDLYTKWYESQNKFYDQEMSNSNKSLEDLKERYKYFEEDNNRLNDSSRQYKELEWKEINNQYGILAQKEAFIKSQLNNSNYDEKTVAQIKQNLTEVEDQEMATMNNLHDSFKEWIADMLTWRTKGYKDSITNYNSQLDLLNEKDSSGSKAKVALNEQALDSYRKVSDGIKEEIAQVQTLYQNEQYGATRDLWKNQLEDLNKQLLENQTATEKAINSLRDSQITEILDDVEKRLRLINNSLEDIDNSSKNIGDNNTSEKLINSMNKASNYITQLKEYTKAYNDVYKTVSADGSISAEDEKKLEDARSKIDSINDALQTTKLDIDSLKLDNSIAQYSQAIDKITNSFSKLDFELSMLSSNDYSNKTSILGGQVGLNNTKVSNLMQEYKELMNQSAISGTKEAETLANKITDVRDKLMEAAKQGKSLKSELADAALSMVFQQVQNPKNKINQLEENIQFQTSMPSNIQGLLLGNNLNYDTKSDTEKELEQTEDISNAVNDMNNKIADLSSNIYDIDSSNITDSIENATSKTNDILKNINDNITKINGANNKSITTKNVYASGADLDNVKYEASKYGLSGLFNFIDTNASGFLWSEHKLSNNDLAIGGTGGGVNGDVELNGATRLAGSDRTATKNIVDDYMKSLADLLKNNNPSDSGTEKTNEQLIKKLDLENTNSALSPIN